MNTDLIIALLAAAVQSGTPVLFAAVGETLTEKAGILNLGIEGLMMMGALAGFLVSKATGCPWLGFFAGGMSGVLLSSIHALVTIGLNGNQVVSGLALTILGTGLSNYFGTPFIGQTAPGFDKFACPFLSDIPLMGPVFFFQDGLVYLSYFIGPAMWFFLKYTRPGLRLRAVGENPHAAAAAGIHPAAYRLAGVWAGGFFAGLGGAYLSLAYMHLWTTGMSAGRGWIAVALVIFAFWNPVKVSLGAYLFGGVMAFQFRLQAMGTHLPSSLLLMLPYVLTVFVMIPASWRGRKDAAPAFLGIPLESAE